MNTTKIRVPMQFFAEEPVEAVSEDTAGTQQGTSVQEGEPKTASADAPTEKTFTQDEVNKMISDRLARQQKQFEAQKEEAAKLAKMNAEQKAQYEAQKREDDLLAREKAVQQKEMYYTGKQILKENNLPESLVECLNLSDAESCNKSIEAIKTAWSDALTKAVDARLKSNPPAYSGGNKTDAFLDGFLKG